MDAVLVKVAPLVIVSAHDGDDDPARDEQRESLGVVPKEGRLIACVWMDDHVAKDDGELARLKERSFLGDVGETGVRHVGEMGWSGGIKKREK